MLLIRQNCLLSAIVRHTLAPTFHICKGGCAAHQQRQQQWKAQQLLHMQMRQPFGRSAQPPHGAADEGTTSIQPTSSTPVRHVLFNAPNSICWLRLALFALAVQQSAVYAAHLIAFWLVLLNMSLDFLDGWLARRFEQATAFGAVFDVLVDTALRGWLWVNALPPAVAWAPPMLELMVFAFSHKVSGAEWKTSFFAVAPSWVQAVMANGFRSPPGAVAVLGLMGCPLWAWAIRHIPSSPYLPAHPAWGYILVPARLLAAAVELWVVVHYMKHLLLQDAKEAAGLEHCAQH